jgi:ABC-type amino acid transport system permease subunit
MTGNVGTAFLVSLAHTASMTLVGGIVATVIYFWLGLKFLSKTWFNLDVVWALSLVAVGAFGIWSALAGH